VFVFVPNCLHYRITSNTLLVGGFRSRIKCQCPFCTVDKHAMEFVIKGNHEKSPHFYLRDGHGGIVWPADIVASRRRYGNKRVRLMIFLL